VNDIAESVQPEKTERLFHPNDMPVEKWNAAIAGN
jgi:hypothetical protein